MLLSSAKLTYSSKVSRFEALIKAFIPIGPNFGEVNEERDCFDREGTLCFPWKCHILIIIALLSR